MFIAREITPTKASYFEIRPIGADFYDLNVKPLKLKGKSYQYQSKVLEDWL